MLPDATHLAPIRGFRIVTEIPPIQPTVSPLRFLVDMFVNTFGITKPTPETERRAGRFIALMLVAVFVCLGLVALLLRSALAR